MSKTGAPATSLSWRSLREISRKTMQMHKHGLPYKQRRGKKGQSPKAAKRKFQSCRKRDKGIRAFATDSCGIIAKSTGHHQQRKMEKERGNPRRIDLVKIRPKSSRRLVGSRMSNKDKRSSSLVVRRITSRDEAAHSHQRRHYMV